MKVFGRTVRVYMCVNTAQLNSRKFLTLTYVMRSSSSRSFHKSGPERRYNVSLSLSHFTLFRPSARTHDIAHGTIAAAALNGRRRSNIYFLDRIQVEPFERDVMKIITPHGNAVCDGISLVVEYFSKASCPDDILVKINSRRVCMYAWVFFVARTYI